MGLKRLLKKSGKVLFAPTKAVIGAVKRNPELTTALVSGAVAVGTGGASLGGILGGLGGIFGGGAPAGAGEAPTVEPAPVAEPPPDHDLVPGFSNKTLLLGGGALALVLLARK